MSSNRPLQHDRTICQRGSAMITAIILSTIIMFGLAGLLPMVMTDLKISEKNSMQEAAFALAESGVEEAVWAVREFGDVDADWEAASWTASESGTFWYKEWTLSGISKAVDDDYTLDEERDGTYRVLVEKAKGSTVNIVSQGRVEGGISVPNGYAVERYIETKFSRPNPFDEAHLAAVNDADLPDVADSYDSEKGSWDAGTNSNENVSIGSASTDFDDVDHEGSTIKGDIVTGGSDDGSDPYADATYTGTTIFDFEMDLPEVAVDTNVGTWKTSL